MHKTEKELANLQTPGHRDARQSHYVPFRVPPRRLAPLGRRVTPRSGRLPDTCGAHCLLGGCPGLLTLKGERGRSADLGGGRGGGPRGGASVRWLGRPGVLTRAEEEAEAGRCEECPDEEDEAPSRLVDVRVAGASSAGELGAVANLLPLLGRVSALAARSSDADSSSELGTRESTTCVALFWKMGRRGTGGGSLSERRRETGGRGKREMTGDEGGGGRVEGGGQEGRSWCER